MNKPRLLTREEFAGMPEGLGWEEDWLEPEDSEEDEYAITRLAWVPCGYTVSDAGFGNKETVIDNYNGKYGTRVWTGDREPTEAERSAEPWETGK